MDPYLVQQQVGDGLPLATGVERKSGLVLPPATVEWRLRHMDPAVFATDPESHLVRFAKALLGDAGVGQLRKRMLLYRLQSALSSSHFYTLDKFYGSLFGVQRRRSEALALEIDGERRTFDPSVEVAGSGEWQQIADADASYRARIVQFAKGLSHGPTPLGIELVSEAILGVDVDVFEDYTGALEPKSLLTWGEVTDFFSTYGGIELFQLTYGMVTVFGGGPVNVPRNTFTIVPKALITSEERRDLYRVLRKVIPVSTSFSVVQPESLEPTYIPVRPRLLDASSRYWEVKNYVVPSSDSAAVYGTTGRTTVKRPPFSAYQGEAWSYIAEVSSVVSYAIITPGEGGVEEPNFESLTFTSGETKSYFPQFALFSPQEISQGRMSSDGILVAHPYSASQLANQRTGDETQLNYTSFQNTTSPLFVEGVRAERAGEANPVARWWSRNTADQYWSSPPRPQDSPVVEAIEVEFDGESDKLSNYVTIDVPRFPHTTTVQAWSSADGWTTVLSHTVTESFPERIPYETGNLHPQHDLDGHWQKVSKRFSPLEVRRIRVLQTRIQGGKAPVDALGIAVPYSLGARRMDLGYRVNSRSDLPQVVRSGEVFATSTDAYGNRLEYEVAEYGPESLLASPTGSWISEPQPTSDAVVRLYADLRNDLGEGQLFDRVWIDPLHPGSTLNLYYSNSDVEARAERWSSSNRPISSEAISNVGSVAVDNFSIRLSTGAPSGIVVDNAILQWDVSQNWWLGLNFTMPNYAVGENDDDETVDPVDPTEPRLLWFSSNADVGTLDDFYTPEGSDGDVLRLGDNYCMALIYEPGELRLVYVTETTARNLRLPLDFQPETPVAITLGWDAAASRFTLGGKTLYGEAVSVDSDGSEEFVEGGAPVNLAPVRFMSLGHPTIPSEGNPVVPEYPSRAVVNSFVLKAGQSPTSAEPDRFLAQPNNYVIKSRFAEPDYDSTDNTVIRYSPTLYADDNPWGMVGGPLAKWDAVEWVPVARDFTAQRGFLYCPPTKARFVCLEFTDLIPQPYEVFANRMQEVEVFANRPEAAVAPSSSDVYASVPGLTSAVGNYTVSDESYNPNAVSLYVSDPELRAELSNNSTMWRFQGIYGSGPARNRFTQTGRHQYATKVVERSERIAFFAGLKDLKFYRLSHSYRDDTAVYLDTLDDTSLLSSFTFRHRDGMLDSKNSATAEAVSKTFTSRTQVYALQFASQQSDAVQVLPNDDFSSPAFLNNDWDGLVIEEVTLNEDTPAALSLNDPLISSIFVSSLDGEVTYREYDDFTVEYGEPTTITRTEESAIGDGEIVRVAYQRETYGWQKIGTASLVYQPEQRRVLIERDVVPESLFRGPDGSVVQRVVNPVFSSRANASVGESDFAGLVSPTVAVTRRGRMEAVVRVTLRTDLTSPLYLGVLNADITGFLGEAVLEQGLAGETHEISLPLTSSDSLAVLPNYGYSTIVDHPIYPMSPVYDDIPDPGDVPDSDWPLADISGGEPTFAGVRVGLYQLGATTDSWYINRMSLYDESLMWEFTADDASNETAVWYPVGGSVRNNPSGAIRFPEPTNRWAFRVTAMRSNLKVNAWQVRPLYVEKAPVQFLPQFRGSNDSLYDQFPPIEQDPMYDNWTRVAPRSWFQSGADFTKASILGVTLPFEGNRPWRRSASVSVSEPDAEAAQDLLANRVVANSTPAPTVTVTAEILPPEE